MSLIRRRPLLRAGMAGGAGYAIGSRRERGFEARATPPAARDGARPARAARPRIEALTKLKGLRDAGVLTEEQYESERRRLTAGI